MIDYSFDLLATYSLTVKGFTYTGTASVRDDFFETHLGAQDNDDVLSGIIEDEGLPIGTDQIIDWELTPAN